jgi:hypothetical protein
MSSNVKAAIIVAVGLVAASVGFGGIFSAHTSVLDYASLWRVNRFTGAIVVCATADERQPPICWDAQMQKGAPTR